MPNHVENDLTLIGTAADVDRCLVVRCGRWSGWLSDRPLSVTGSSAVYRIVWSTGRWPNGR